MYPRISRKVNLEGAFLTVEGSYLGSEIESRLTHSFLITVQLVCTLNISGYALEEHLKLDLDDALGKYYLYFSKGFRHEIRCFNRCLKYNEASKECVRTLMLTVDDTEVSIESKTKAKKFLETLLKNFVAELTERAKKSPYQFGAM